MMFDATLPLRAPSSSAPPQRAEESLVLGDYRILREIGRGGMGIVYEAEQLSLHRRVALKVMVGPHRIDAPSRERFEREARSAARLHHTNIVPVFEVGQDGDVCFYVMQFIDGIGLDALIAHLNGEARPGTFALPDELASAGHPEHFRAVARLAFQAAGGLDHAHVRCVIHRDIKPANLLLDTAGVVWITDFGVAKLADENLTRTGERFGTLRYMPPEQFQGQSDARSDVYSLGVTLYELVTRRPAYPDPSGPGHVPLLTDEPTRPRRLDRRIPRDLETILLKAMERDPGRRYATAAEFADDLRRFLDNEPIRARPVGPLGQAVRWARRSPVLASLTAAVLLLTATVILGAVTTALTYHRQAQAERGLRRDADEAREVADEANRASGDVASFLLGVLDEADPLSMSGRVFGGDGRDRAEQFKPEKVLERALARLDAATQVAPKVRATLLDKFGSIYISLGRLDRAEPLLEQALRMRRAEHGDDSLEVAETLHNLGYLNLTRKTLPPAERAYRRALAIRERTLGAEAALVTDTLIQLAIVKGFGDAPGESIALLRRVMDTLRKQSAAESREYGLALVLLVLVLFNENATQEALELLPEAMRLVKKYISTGPLPSAMQAHLDGRVAQSFGLKAQAARRYGDAVGLVEKSLGSGHFLVVLGRNHLAGYLHTVMKDHAAAEREYRASIRSSDQFAGPGSVATATTKLYLARVLRDAKRFAEAETLLREASEVMRAMRHRSLGRCLHILAEVLQYQGKRKEALPVLREAVRERKRAGNLLWYSHTASDFAEELRSIGRLEEAVSVLRESNLHLAGQPSLDAETSWALARRCAQQCQLLLKLGGREAEVEEAARLAADAVRATAKGQNKPVRDLAQASELSVLREHPAFKPLFAAR
jgi:tetratricopeptide (TPR) repeat protein